MILESKGSNYHVRLTEQREAWCGEIHTLHGWILRFQARGIYLCQWFPTRRKATSKLRSLRRKYAKS